MLEDLSIKNEHSQITTVSHLLRLKILVSYGIWAQVDTALQAAEDSLGLIFEPDEREDAGQQQQQDPVATSPTSRKQREYKTFPGAFDAAMAVHILMIGVIFHAHSGSEYDMSVRLGHLHFLMDRGDFKGGGNGIVEVSLPHLKVTVMTIVSSFIDNV